MNKRYFEVSQLFPLPYNSANQWIEVDKCDATFFEGEKSQYIDAVGCYVFFIRAGRGHTPYYVGKTNKSFVQEAFNDRNLLNFFMTALKGKGTPHICFVKCQDKKGPVPSKIIDEVETYLIEKAYAKNKDLINKRKIPNTTWAISGVYRSDPGQPSKDAVKFKDMMGIGPKKKK